jgi:hypothetical protein
MPKIKEKISSRKIPTDRNNSKNPMAKYFFNNLSFLIAHSVCAKT